MDFKDWKVTKFDGKKATLTHKDGHFMSVALKSLAKDHRNQLQLLAQGGKVKGVNTSYTGDGTSKPGSLVRAGEPGDMELAKKHHRKTLTEMRADKGDRRNMAQGGQVPATSPTVDPDKARQIQNGFNQALGTPTPTPTPAPQPPRQNYEDGGGVGSILLPDNTLNAPAAVGLGEQAIGEQQGVDTAQQEALVAPEKEMIAKQQNIAAQQAAHYNELKQHTQDFENYIKQNPINAQAYQESRTSGQKTMQGLGLLLGGMGGGLGKTGGNAAADFLNKQIDRDIDAQKENAKNRHTVWGAYHDMYGDSNIATNLAKVSANDILVHKAQLIAHQLGTPQAQAKADAMKAEFAIKNHELLLDSSGRLGTISTGGGGGTGSPGSAMQAPGQGQQAPGPTPAGGEPPQQLEPVGGKSTLMHQGAEHALNAMGYIKSGPIAQNYKEMLGQYNGVRQSEKGMQTVDQVFPQLQNETNFGQYIEEYLPSVATTGAAAGGYAMKTLKDAMVKGGGVAAGAGGAAALAAAAAAFGPEILAAGGLGAAVAGASGAASGVADKANKAVWSSVERTRQYKSDQSLLLGALSGALKGTNVGGGQIEGIVEKNTPEWKDSKATLEKKAKNIKEFIKAHTDTSLLKLHHLTDE